MAMVLVRGFGEGQIDPKKKWLERKSVADWRVNNYGTLTTGTIILKALSLYKHV